MNLTGRYNGWTVNGWSRELMIRKRMKEVGNAPRKTIWPNQASHTLYIVEHYVWHTVPKRIKQVVYANTELWGVLSSLYPSWEMTVLLVSSVFRHVQAETPLKLDVSSNNIMYICTYSYFICFYVLRMRHPSITHHLYVLWPHKRKILMNFMICSHITCHLLSCQRRLFRIMLSVFVPPWGFVIHNIK